MPLNSTQHYSHTELTDFCETFLLIFNCCRRRRGGGETYTPGISAFSIFAVRLTKKAIEVRRGRWDTTPPNLLIINTGDWKETDVLPVHQHRLNCQSEISVKLLSAFIRGTWADQFQMLLPLSKRANLQRNTSFLFWSIKSHDIPECRLWAQSGGMCKLSACMCV